jgi:hypothetical protein
VKDIDMLLELYKEQRDLGIHHENQRSTVSNLILTVATVLIALISIDNHLTKSDLPVALTLTFLGIFGALFTLKNYERFSFHRHRSRLIRKAIDAALKWGELNNDEDHRIRYEIRATLGLDMKNSDQLLIEAIVNKANDQYKGKNRFLYKIDLHNFWVGLHLVISVVGLAIIIIIQHT